MELRRINFCANCGDDSCGSCDCSPQTNSFEQSIRGAQGVQGAQGLRGLNGKNNVLNGSELLDSTGGNQNGTDEALGGSVTSALTTAGFNPTEKPTLVATVDTTDITNTKYWVRMSNAFMNFIYNGILPRLLPSGGTTNQILKKTSGTDYAVAWANQTGEAYNTTSDVNNISIDATIIALQGYGTTNLSFSVDAGLAYKKGQQIWMTQYNSNVFTPANYMIGIVLDYSSNTLVVRVLYAYGTGTPSKWYISLGSPVQIPYFDTTTNNGQYLLNTGSGLGWGQPLMPSGSVTAYFGLTIPSGWLECNGQAIEKQYYPQLYDVLYPIFGGTSTQTYVPNLIGKTLVGKDPSDTNIDTLGESYGVKTNTIGDSNLPVISPWNVTDSGHTHSYEDKSANTSDNVAAGGGGSTRTDLTDQTRTTATGYANIQVAQNTGGGQPINNFQPSLVCTWIIKI